MWAGESGRVELTGCRGVVKRDESGDAVAEFEGRFDRFGESLLQIGADSEAIDDDLDRVFALTVDLGQGIEFVDLAIDAHAQIALALQGLEDARLFALAVDDDW